MNVNMVPFKYSRQAPSKLSTRTMSKLVVNFSTLRLFTFRCFIRPFTLPQSFEPSLASKINLFNLCRVDLYDHGKKTKTLMFVQPLASISVATKNFQLYCLPQQLYVYKNWHDLHDCLKTGDNPLGLHCYAGFGGRDEERFIVGSIAESKAMSIMIRDYLFQKDIMV